MPTSTPTPGIEEAVALACLRPGPDTRAARALKELLAEPAGPGLLGRLADRLDLPDRGYAMQEAHRFAGHFVASAARLGILPLPWDDPRYPALLREIADPPIVLWVKGRVESLSRPAIAIVGSRAGTPTGLRIAQQLGEALAEAGLVVVSGLARGVDGASHRGALAGQGETVAVLGCGTDVVYPAEHRGLAERIAEHGALVSEFPPGTPPRAAHFPRRNRIISGLCRAVVVIEASERSGSLITARMALEQGRDVMAVPGNVLSGRSRGCHALIKDGARLVETVEDVLGEVGWRPAPVLPGLDSDKSFNCSDLVETMAAGEPYSLDELASATGRPPADLLARLTSLELAGQVTRIPGGCFVRLDVRC